MKYFREFAKFIIKDIMKPTYIINILISKFPTKTAVKDRLTLLSVRR